VSAADGVAAVLLAAGVLVVVASAVGALTRADVLDRVHFLTPVTSLGAPLVGAALAVANGWTATTGQILLTVLLLAVTGPVLGSATARLAAQQRGQVSSEDPE
jgi:multisubunit Na+/H+ antiporter MnhG subunit